MNIELTYCDFSIYNNWNNIAKKWTQYKNNDCRSIVMMLRWAHFKQQEKYYIRCLLLVRNECTLYDNICTYEG